MRIPTLIVAALAAMSAGAAAAQSQDPAGAAPGPRADCTLDKAMICKADGCNPTSSLGDLPLPARVLVDQITNVIATVGPNGLPHVSEIGVQGTTAGSTVVLQGVDGTAGWMMHGSPADPMTSFVISSNDTVLVSFGNCTPLP
jgi:hypothetical protein